MTSSQKGKNWTIPSSKTEAGQQHLVQLKSHNSNTEKYTVLLHYSVVKTKVSPKKKNMAVHPLSTTCRLKSLETIVSSDFTVDFHPRPQAVADGTDTIAFIGG
jgi:hypothetical protein